MWREIGLLGRDEFLKGEVYRRVKGRAPAFVLIGGQGVGKSAVLEWAFDQAEEPKALVSCTWTLKEVLKKIVSDWALEVRDESGKKVNLNRAKNEDLEKVILAQEEGLIFVDDFHRATPTKLYKIKVWNDRFKLFFAGSKPFKHEIMKACLLGHSHLKIKPLPKAERLRLAQAVCLQLASKNSPQEVALHSGGIPGKIVSIARGDLNAKESGEVEPELDTSFLYLVLFVLLVCLRVIGRGVGDTALYMVGALVMISGLIFRVYLYRGMKK